MQTWSLSFHIICINQVWYISGSFNQQNGTNSRSSLMIGFWYKRQRASTKTCKSSWLASSLFKWWSSLHLSCLLAYGYTLGSRCMRKRSQDGYGITQGRWRSTSMMEQVILGSSCWTTGVCISQHSTGFTQPSHLLDMVMSKARREMSTCSNS